MKSAILLRLSFLLLLILDFASLAFSQDAQLRSDLSGTFSKFDVVKVAPQDSLERSAEKRLVIQTTARNFDLVVTPNNILSPRYRTENDGLAGKTMPGNAGIHTFKGHIEGFAKSEVRLTIDGAKVEGFFDADGERFFIEPARKFSGSAKAEDSVVYKADDVINTSPYFCESDIATQVERTEGIVGERITEAFPSYRVIELATEADLEFVQTLGGAAQANSEILSILNMVEGTYNADLGLSIRVVFQHTWTTADPFAGTANNVILNAFTNHWNTNYPNASVPRDAAHLFTAKAPALGRGLAWVGVCAAIRCTHTA